MTFNFFNRFSAVKGKHTNMTGKVFGGASFTAKGLQLGAAGKKRAEKIIEQDAASRHNAFARDMGNLQGRTFLGTREVEETKAGFIRAPQDLELASLHQQFRDNHALAADNGNTETLNLHNAGFTLAFMHVPTGREVEFKAFLDQISDAYTTNWSQESVYGRMDQIATFQNTQRAIAVSWIVPAGSEIEALDNMRRIQHLMQFMYPLYSDDGILLSAPLLRLKFANLIRDGKTGKGVLGYVNGFTVDPDQEAGYFAYSKGPMTEQAELYPKAIRLNCDFTVLHEHDLGYRRHGDAGYVFGRSSQELYEYPQDIVGVDFPFPAGAGQKEIDGDPYIPVSRNSHFGAPVIPGDEVNNEFRRELMFEDVSPKNAKYNNRRKAILDTPGIRRTANDY